MTDYRVEESVLIERPTPDVFAAWSTGPSLAAWFAPMAVRPPEVEMAFKEGGTYRIVMDLGPGGVHTIVGQFIEIVPNERISMSWRCDAWVDPPSKVDVTFEPLDQATVVWVRHTHITTGEALEGQTMGWKTCLANLAKPYPHT